MRRDILHEVLAYALHLLTPLFLDIATKNTILNTRNGSKTLHMIETVEKT